MISFFAEVKIFIFRPKTMDYSKAFRSNLTGFFLFSFNSHNSSLEGAMKLKFAPFCSS